MYEDEVSVEIDRWVAVQLGRSPEMRDDVMDAALWVLLGESVSAIEGEAGAGSS